MLHNLLIFLFAFNLTTIKAHIVIKSTELRSPKPNDIGLIFDLAVLNSASGKKETLDFHIRCERCYLTLTNNTVLCEAARMTGGDFGQIMPEQTKIITLIWPTVTLFNRLGYCDLTLTSGNQTGGKFKIFHKINFNTTLNSKHIPENLRVLVGDKNISDCSTPDLHPLLDCIPINCEEKYFGQRNFFNTRKNVCEAVPNCSTYKTLVYDYTINECVDLNHVMCEEDLILLQKGKFDNNTWEADHDEKVAKQGWFDIGDNMIMPIDTQSEFQEFPWDGLINCMLMILAAMAIYLMISLLVFSLVMACIRRLSSSRKNILFE